MKLNIGAGQTELDGFLAIDRNFGGEAYPLTFNDGNPVGDESVEEIRASHILEHFGFDLVPKVIDCWYRTLKPGGKIRVSVPDMDRIIDLREKGDKLWSRYLMGDQHDNNHYHRSVFTRGDLKKLMGEIGLVDITTWESDNTDTASHPVSCNLEGSKPMVARAPISEAITDTVLDLKIAAVMSLPRYGNNLARGMIESTLQKFNIPLNAACGAYWGHHLQDAFETMIDNGVSWVITFDHDTMCTAAHLDRLFHWMGRRPDIDALAALQMRRNHDTPLMTRRGEKSSKVDGTPIKAHTAHFGMTLIRVEALKRVPLPWFFELPTKHGSWTDESRPPEVKVSPWLQPVIDKISDGQEHWCTHGQYHVDEDIWFWKQWERAGNTVFVAPDVRIGHLEECVNWFDDEMKPQRSGVQEWRDMAAKEMLNREDTTFARMV